MMKQIGRFLLGLAYLAIPILGWIALYNSFKRVKSDEISIIRNFSGKAELIEEGIYFRPFPGDQFGETYNKSAQYIDFGPLKRVRINGDELAFKTTSNGDLVELAPGLHVIDLSLNETFDPQKAIKKKNDDFLDFDSKKFIRVKEGQLGVKTDSKGNYVELHPGMHMIDTAMGETFNPVNGICNTGLDDYVLGNNRYITIRNGELGESYRNGEFVLLEAGRHKLPTTHRFVKKVPVDSDVIDLGALKIVTVKEGQVAVINTSDGVVVKSPGKHDIKQSEGNFFNALISTSPQGVRLPALTVMCSDRIEMRAESMLVYRVEDPLKTVGLGIDVIVDFLKIFADGTLRTILSRFSSSDIAPSLHTDEDHYSTKRSEKLVGLHDECVRALDEKATEWGLRVTDLQILEILPADAQYLKTIRDLGSQQSTAEASRNLAENEAAVAEIRAKAEESRVVAAGIEQREAIIRADTEAKVREIASTSAALQRKTLASAEADAINLVTGTEVSRIEQLSKALESAPAVVQQMSLLEAQKEIYKAAPNSIFIQPELGNTSVVDRTGDRVRFFTTNKGSTTPPLIDLMAVSNIGQQMLSGGSGG